MAGLAGGGDKHLPPSFEVTIVQAVLGKGDDVVDSVVFAWALRRTNGYGRSRGHFEHCEISKSLSLGGIGHVGKGVGQI